MKLDAKKCTAEVEPSMFRMGSSQEHAERNDNVMLEAELYQVSRHNAGRKDVL